LTCEDARNERIILQKLGIDDSNIVRPSITNSQQSEPLVSPRKKRPWTFAASQQQQQREDDGTDNNTTHPPAHIARTSVTNVGNEMTDAPVTVRANTTTNTLFVIPSQEQSQRPAISVVGAVQHSDDDDVDISDLAFPPSTRHPHIRATVATNTRSLVTTASTAIQRNIPTISTTAAHPVVPNNTTAINPDPNTLPPRPQFLLNRRPPPRASGDLLDDVEDISMSPSHQPSPSDPIVDSSGSVVQVSQAARSSQTVAPVNNVIPVRAIQRKKFIS